MSQMKELYAKVAADSILQGQFAEIMKGAEAAGKEATAEKLVAFAKDAGYEVSFDEIAAYFNEKDSSEELDDAELEMVAGGKQSASQWFNGLIKDTGDFFYVVGEVFKQSF